MSFTKVFLELRGCLRAALVIFAITASLATQAMASETAVKEFQRAVYDADFKSGADNMRAMLEVDPGDTEALFALGALQLFDAIARMQKGLFEHTGKIEGTAAPARGLFAIPSLTTNLFLVPANPNAKPMTYEIFRNILTRFASDLVAAEATLARVGDRSVKLPLQPFAIALDLNHDDRIDPRERIFATMMDASRRMRGTMIDMRVVFDTADASWLRGYTNVFLATTNLLLAFDFERTFKTFAHQTFGPQATPFGRELSRLRTRGRPAAEIRAELNAVYRELRELGNKWSMNQRKRELEGRLAKLAGDASVKYERQVVEAELSDLKMRLEKMSQLRAPLLAKARQLRTELNSDQYGTMMDLVAAIHSISWRVISRDRLQASRRHLLAVMDINQTTWRLVRAETDDDAEWIPNPRQTPPARARRITNEIINSWLATTSLAGDILRGKKLLPHPRFKRGINLKKLFDTAERFDLVNLVTGHDLGPFLEKGEIADAATWSAIARPMGRNVGTYAIWFN